MKDNIDFENENNDDVSWDYLFNSAKDYEKYEEVPDCDTATFHKSLSLKEKRYHTPLQVLKSLFGYDSFRQGQKTVIDSILSGRDVFAVMPTGDSYWSIRKCLI